MRIGQGYDVHRLVEGRKLIIGGVEIPFERGLQGHSDADVLCHAIADALLGAAGLGDLGRHFPDDDERYAGISSLKILAAIRAQLAQKRLSIQNVDATLICQRPKLAPHFPAMYENICRSLELDLSRLNIKATTEEGLGFTGREEGIAASAIALLE